MNKTKKAAAMLLAAILTAGTLAACAPGQTEPAATQGVQTSEPAAATPAVDLSGYTSRTKQTGEFFATTSTLSVFDDFSDARNDAKLEQTWEEIKGILNEIEQAVSLAVETSDIARFNALQYGESMRVSRHTAKIIQISKSVYEQGEGLYDPTVYPLVDLWGFTPRFSEIDYVPEQPYDRDRSGVGFELPDKRYVDAFVKLVNFDQVVLSGDEQSGYTLKKMIPPVTVDGVVYNAALDFGGIAKGYAVDLIADVMRGHGYEYGYFSCGSSSIALLKSATETSRKDGTLRYRLGLRKPRTTEKDGAIYMSIALKDVTLSTSGDYDHSYTLGDVIYCHLIDPRTGYPINTPADGVQKGIATVTVIGGDAGYCEAMSKVLCVKGPLEAIAYMNRNLKDFKVVIVLYDAAYDYYEVVTNMTQEQYAIEDPAYVLASDLDGEGNAAYEGKFLR